MIGSKISKYEIQLKATISIFFIIGSILFTYAGFKEFVNLSFDGGMYYIWGSVFYTAAGYIQIITCQSEKRKRFIIIPQFIGIMFFNISAITPEYSSYFTHTFLEIWSPDFIGCVLFLISGYFFILFNHDRFTLLPQEKYASYTTVVNFWGAIFFMLAALFAFSKLNSIHLAEELSVLSTALGGICFTFSSTHFFFEKETESVSIELRHSMKPLNNVDFRRLRTLPIIEFQA